ncbi:hypothetical protein [Spirillospora sp. NPDC048824]|uniref:hypothetical protein n=1 Tax=Spirillospora sp. NPDC048824 TaxID=3364526 RepID=UPI00371C18F6
MIDLTDEFLTPTPTPTPTPGTISYWPAGLDHPVAGTWSLRFEPGRLTETAKQA